MLPITPFPIGMPEDSHFPTKHLIYAARKGWPKGFGEVLTEGIWRKSVKGCRGATPKPGSMSNRSFVAGSRKKTSA